MATMLGPWGGSVLPASRPTPGGDTRLTYWALCPVLDICCAHTHNCFGPLTASLDQYANLPVVCIACPDACGVPHQVLHPIRPPTPCSTPSSDDHNRPMPRCASHPTTSPRTNMPMRSTPAFHGQHSCAITHATRFMSSSPANRCDVMLHPACTSAQHERAPAVSWRLRATFAVFARLGPARGRADGNRQKARARLSRGSGDVAPGNPGT